MYRLIVLGRDGMYSYGDLAQNESLARLVPGNLQRRTGERLGITLVREAAGTWRDSAGHSHQRYEAPVLVAAEAMPGEWQIGARAEREA